MLNISLMDKIKENEGFTDTPFWDLKQWTWGYGCTAPGENDKHYYDNREKPTITKLQAENLLRVRLQQCVDDFERVFKNQNINTVRKEALIEMIFNIGLTSFMKFNRMIRYIRENNFKAAAFEAMDSRWFKQLTIEFKSDRAYKIVLDIGRGH